MLLNILKDEVSLKEKKVQERLLKNAGFPIIKRIEDFALNFQKSITSRQINRLLELEWIDRMFNLIFLGPPGVGKTHLAIAMGLKAVDTGYKVSFVSMDTLMNVLKTQDISRKSKGKVNNILSSSLALFVKVVVVWNFSVRYLFFISEYSINLSCITSVIKMCTI